MEMVDIGPHRLPVVPQKHARLRHKLSAEDFQGIMSSKYGAESYRVLGVLIPELLNKMPLWEWDGYASEEAMRNETYDEDKDNSPTTAEIVNAFEKALMVSGAGRLGKLLDLFKGAQGLTENQTPATSASPTPASPASPGVSGE